MIVNLKKGDLAVARLFSQPRRYFFQKMMNGLQNSENKAPVHIVSRRNDSYNDQYLQKEFLKYVSEIGVPPLNSYNIVNSKIIQTDFFSQKTMFRIAAQAQFVIWMEQYLSLLDGLVNQNMEPINKLCEESLAERFEIFLNKVDKSQLALVKITPPEPLDVLIYPEYQQHRSVEGVSIHRKLNQHESQYFKKETKEKLVFQKVSEKQKSKWALLNLQDESTQSDKEELFLNQYLISFQTNVRLNLVKKSDPTEIVYGSNDLSKFSTHFIQIENIRSLTKTTDYIFTDIDNLLNGNPYVTP